MKAAQVIGAHDPDEMHARTPCSERADGVIGVAGSHLRLDPGHDDARIVRELSRRGDTLGKRREPARILQRIAGRHQPPHAIEIEPRHREQTSGAMRRMRRIERAAEQPDA